MIESKKVALLIVGMRKAGTSWLYENFKNDDDFSVSTLVKESGYFAGTSNLTVTEYEGLFEHSPSGVKVEADASICVSVDSPERISAYSDSIKLVLILRHPAEYVVSRFIHSRRKGEIRQSSIEGALRENQWFRTEIDYKNLVERYQKFAYDNKLLVVFFDQLKEDPRRFYDEIKRFVLDDTGESGYFPSLEVVNESRTSSQGLVSSLLSYCAKYFRKRNMHQIVNFSKSFRFHERLESTVEAETKKEMTLEALRILNANYPETIRYYEMLKSEND